MLLMLAQQKHNAGAFVIILQDLFHVLFISIVFWKREDLENQSKEMSRIVKP